MRAIAGALLIACLATSCVATSELAIHAAPPPSTLKNPLSPTPLSRVSQAIAEGDLLAAREILEKARAEGASEGVLDLASAVIALSEERLGSAEKYLDSAAIASPDQAAVDLLRGRMQEMRGHWSEARDAYHIAGRKDPDSMTAVVQEARVLVILGQPTEAAVALKRAVESMPTSAELQRAAGEAWLAAQDPRQAVPYLRRAHALDATDRAAFEALALALFRLGRHAEVVKLLDGQKSDEMPDHIRLVFGRSALLAGQPDLAARMLEPCTAAFDEDVEVWLDLARAHALAGRTTEAAAAAERASALEPQSPRTLLLMGHIHKLAGRSREASTCYAQALRNGADPVLVAPLVEALVPSNSSRSARAPDESCGDEGTAGVPAPKGRVP
jgi:Flp pilus assembly protein TadD